MYDLMGLFILCPCHLPRPPLSLPRVQTDVQGCRLTGVHRGTSSQTSPFIHFTHSFIRFFPVKQPNLGLCWDLNCWDWMRPLCNSLNYIWVYLTSEAPSLPLSHSDPRGTLGLTFKWLSALPSSKKSYQNFWKGKPCVRSLLGKFVFAVFLLVMYPHI